MIIFRPNEIENESMKIIQGEIDRQGGYSGPAENLEVIKRVIHATADFDFLKILEFSNGAVMRAREALRKGAVIITDTSMMAAGISKITAEKYGVKVICNSSDQNIRREAQARGVTRAVINIEHSTESFPGPGVIYAIGNAPTALIRLCELVKEKKSSPDIIIGVPVGFVNVIEAKELLSSLGDEYKISKIFSRGRKGGSTVACAIVNALLYGLK